MIRKDVRTKCSMYRTGEDYFDYKEDKEKTEGEKKIEKLLSSTGGEK